jgi:hypothetical protein
MLTFSTTPSPIISADQILDRQIKIENLGVNSSAESMDGIDVVWVATNPEEGGRRVVGWYHKATVYRRRQEFESFPSSQHKKDGVDTYRIYAKSEDATLLPFEERSAPALRLGTGTGWIGEANWWFPERQSDSAIKKFVRGLREVIDGHGEDVSNQGAKRTWGGGGSDIQRKAEVERAAINAVENYYHGLYYKKCRKR